MANQNLSPLQRFTGRQTPEKPKVQNRKVSDERGRVLPYRFCPADNPNSAPLIVFFHGWTSAENDDGSWAPHPDWNVVAPKDRFGLNRQGCWWLGENGEYFMFGLIRRMVDEVMAELGGPRDLFVSGNSMGGFGALIHGLTLGAKAIYCNVPQVRLRNCQFADLHAANLGAVFGADVEARCADATNFLNRVHPHANPVIFVGQTRHDIHRHYFTEQFLYLVEKMNDADCVFHLLVQPTRGHYNVVPPEEVFGLFKTWWHAIHFPPDFEGEHPAGHQGVRSPSRPEDLLWGKQIDAGDQLGNPCLRGIALPEHRVGQATAALAGDAETPSANALRTRASEREALIASLLAELKVERLRTVLEFEAGSGMLIPAILTRHPSTHAFIADSSLARLAAVRELLMADYPTANVIPVWTGPDDDCGKFGACDLVLGFFTLRRALDPARQLAKALKLVAPGGHAVFFEPLALGHDVFRTLIHTIQIKARLHRWNGPALSILRLFNREIARRTRRKKNPSGGEAPDNWILPLSLLAREGRRHGFRDFRLVPFDQSERPFRDRLSQLLTEHDLPRADALPPWAWRLADRFDSDFLSHEGLSELSLNGCIVFQR